MLELVNRHHDDATAGHHRLRGDYRGLDHRVEAVEEAQATSLRRIDKLENAPPPEVSTLRFSWPVVVFVVTTIVGAAGGQWASTSGLRSDVRDILTQMAAKDRTEALKDTLQKERADRITESLGATDKQLTLLKLQFQELQNTVLDLKRSK